MSEDTRTAEPVRGKILKFPSLIAEKPTAAVALPAAGGMSAAAAPSAPPASATPSAFQRLAAVRRRRGDRSSESESTPRASKVQATRPSVSQLVTWLLNLRKGGVGYLYWNAAKLPIEVALVRAARLDDDAIVDVVGHRILVVEPLRPRTAVDAATSPASVPDAEAVLP